jgi:hypothetical protein
MDGMSGSTKRFLERACAYEAAYILPGFDIAYDWLGPKG